jgi:hypothetical protein
VTIAKRPFELGGDGKGYIADLGLRKIRIFLQMGLDRILLICPTRLGKNCWAFLRVEVRFGYDESYIQERREP